MLKCWPEPFLAIVEGRKTHEFRRNDRGYAVGDVLILVYWDPTPNPNRVSKQVGTTKTSLCTSVKVTYVGVGFGIPDGFVVLSIQPHVPDKIEDNHLLQVDAASCWVEWRPGVQQGVRK